MEQQNKSQVLTAETPQTEAPAPEVSVRPRTGIGRAGRIMLVFAFLIPFVWLGALRICVMKTGENSQDALYHAMMAKLGPGVYAAKEFPWTQMSVWKDRFADKELLYHAGINVIFAIEKAFGAALNPPFHVAALFYSALAILGCLFAARRLGVRPLYLLLGAPFFSVIVPNYTFRLSVLRPHILSIAFLTFTAGLLAKGSFRFRLAVVGVLSFCFAWSYSNPHFIVIIPLIFAVSRLKSGGWRELWLPVLSLGGVLLGLLLHPQFPNSFVIWKVQSWDALIAPMMAGVRLSKPSEMLAPRFGFNRTAAPLYLMAWCILMMFVRLLERKGFRKIDPNIVAITFLAGGFTAGIFVAVRTVEYAGPFVAIAFLLLLEHMTREGFHLPLHKFKWGVPGLLAALSVGLGIYSSYYFRKECPQVIVQPLPKITAFLKENVPAGCPVVNLDWSDFPALFYNDTDHLWQWGMDPMFSYSKDPRRTLLLTSTTPGLGGDPYPEDVYKAFGSKYAVLLWPRISQASYLYDHGWKIVQSYLEPGEEEGWIFALDERLLYPQPGTFQKRQKESPDSVTN
ncbi:MAG: hypothetical protein IKC53_00540 [Lentisphaeria bacterium]|nr:hypothetical protein [Lentisphaeria bacterium]